MFRKCDSADLLQFPTNFSRRKPTLFAVDDERQIGDIVAYAGVEAGFDVHVMCSALEMMEKCGSLTPDVVVLDIIMPDTDGVELVRWLAQKNCGSSIVLMSGYDERHLKLATSLAEALSLNIVTTLQKPIALTTLGKLFRTLKDQVSQYASDKARSRKLDKTFY